MMYDQKVRSRLYFEQIKFNKDNRIIHIFSKGQSILSGNLGATIHLEHPYKCLPQDELDDGSECMEWNGVARLYLNLDTPFLKQQPVNSSVRCYTVRWDALHEDYHPTDCFNIGSDRGQWYGGGLTKDADFPLHKASFKLSPFISGDSRINQWGNAVRRYFLNSKGVAIEVDEKTPLYIGINEDYKNQMCFQARYDDFAFVNRLTPLPQLKYRVCTADDPFQLHLSLTQKSLWDGLTEHETGIIKKMLAEPVWSIPTTKEMRNFTDITISNYTQNVFDRGLYGLGYVLINEFWQKKIGDFELDEERFENLTNTIEVSHRRGFRIAMMIQPYISTESKNFAEAVQKKLLITERHSQKDVPALTRYKSSLSAGILDITNNATIPWLVSKLEKISNKYKINSFYLDYGTAYDIPRYYQCSQILPNPDHYKTIFTKRLGSTGSINLLGVTSAMNTPRPPAFLSLPQVNASWNSLQTIISSAITYGLIGYPFLMPGSVGGDFVLRDHNETHISHQLLETPEPPERELYIRWLQISTFLPVLHFDHIPFDYKDDLVTEVAKELLNIRQKTVVPILNKYYTDAMNEGLPLIRPLWMLDPNTLACQNITDEFSVGDELIVAPILKKGQTQREVMILLNL